MRIKHRKVLVEFIYLVTKDIVETLERKFGYRLGSGLKEEIKSWEGEFLSSFWPFIPEVMEKAELDASSVSKQLTGKVRETGCPVVSLDRVYVLDADQYLEVTRITDPETGEVRIAERPGTKPLQEQISDLKRYQRIVLADVGAFEGTTLLEICGAIEKEGIAIEGSYLGVSNYEANRKINNQRKLTTLNLFDLDEWIELRDFFGIDGRQAGMQDGVRLFIPYCENLAKWASIPKESEQEVADLCKRFNRRLMSALERDGCDLAKIGKAVKYSGGK